MTNKYEQAVSFLAQGRGGVYAEAYDLAITLLRAAARLPDGVDPVQVLNEYASYQRKLRAGAGQAIFNPVAYDAECVGCNPPAPTEAESEREHCRRVSTNFVNRQVDRYPYADAEKFVTEERADAYKAGFEAGRKAGGK